MKIHYYIFTLAAAMLVHAPIYALKLMSPEAVCMQRGLAENTVEWDACLDEVKHNNDRITAEFYATLNDKESRQTPPDYTVSEAEKRQVYGIDTGIVPPMMRKSLTKRIQENQKLFIPQPLK